MIHLTIIRAFASFLQVAGEMSRFNSAWNQEFEVLREVQEDRLHMTASLKCVDRCIGTNIFTNVFLPHESKCMEACLAKYTQANVIANINMQKFNVAEDAAAKIQQAAAKKR